MLTSIPRLCGSIAGKASTVGVHIHNAAYRALGLNWTYVAFSVADAAAALHAMRTLAIRGYGVTMPHKETVIPHVDAVDPEVKVIGAANTVVNDDGHLTARNSDWRGMVGAIEEVCPIAGKRVLVIGGGGATRGAVYGLKEKGAGSVTLYNRTAAKAHDLAEEFGVGYGGRLADLAGASPFDILINASAAGYRTNPDLSLPPGFLRPEHVVMDMVAEPLESGLLAQARRVGCGVAPGWRMRLLQAAVQFEAYTGQPAPIAVMEKALLEAMG